MLDVESFSVKSQTNFDERLAQSSVEERRQLAIEAGNAAPGFRSLSDFWLELVQGNWRRVDDFCAGDRCYLVVRATPGQHRRALRPRPLEFLERRVLGECEKVIAFEAGVSISTVAGSLSQSMAQLGFEVGPPRVPLLATIAVHALHGKAGVVAGQIASHSCLPESVVVSARRPTPCPLKGLSPAECDVVSLLSEGLSNRQIAARRQSSPRTVANQIASVFGKFGVSGRRPLLSRLVIGSAVSVL